MRKFVEFARKYEIWREIECPDRTPFSDSDRLAVSLFAHWMDTEPMGAETVEGHSIIDNLWLLASRAK